MGWVKKSNIRGLQGLPGQSGLNGKNGQDAVGKDGEDAPFVTRVEVLKKGKDNLFFRFHYSDLTIIDTNTFSIPAIGQAVSQFMSIRNSFTIFEGGVDLGEATALDFDEDASNKFKYHTRNLLLGGDCEIVEEEQK